MSSHRKEARYFEKAGSQNTDELIETVKEYLKRENLENIVVASTTGETGAKASKVFKGRSVVVVTHAHGSREPGESELLPEYEKQIRANGAVIFTGTHALSGAERAIRKDFGTIQTLELFANVLRLLGEGTKVCVEITLMAADAGLIPIDRDVVAIGGTGRGADTALRVRPANASRFFNLKIKEVIAKPSEF